MLNMSRNSVATHDSDEEDDVNCTQRDEPWVHSYKGNEAIRNRGNEAIRNRGNEANYGYGDKASYNYYYGGNYYGYGASYYGSCYGNELYPTPYTPASSNWMPQMPRIPPSSMLYPWCWPGPPPPQPPPSPPPGWNPIQEQPGSQSQPTAQAGQPSRKRPQETARKANNNSTEDEVDPFVLTQECRELLGECRRVH